MDGCVVFVFSGTGNTAFVADRIKENLEKKDVQTTIHNIDELKEIPDISAYEYIGLGYPVYAWAMPPNVEEFAQKIPAAKEGQKGFVFTTYGGNGLYAVQQGVDILKSKKYRICRSRGFLMPDNITVSFISSLARVSPDGELKMFDKAAEAIPGMVNEIISGDGRVEGHGWIPGWAFSRLLGFLFKKWGAAGEGKKYYLNDACTSCGLCAKTCPVQNIEMVDGKPRWLDHCVLCCRCYNLCPVKAIDHPGSPDRDHRYKAPGYKPPIINRD